MRQDRSWLTACIALMAMTVLLAAVPLHHARMVLAALDVPALAIAAMEHAGNQDGAQASGGEPHHQGSHGRADGTAHPYVQNAHTRPAAALPESGQSSHEMPRCPVCNTVTLLEVPVPEQGPIFLQAPRRAATQRPAAYIAFSSALQFRTDLPRGPPTAG